MDGEEPNPVRKTIDDLLKEMEGASRSKTYKVTLYGCEMPFRFPKDSDEIALYPKLAIEFARRMSGDAKALPKPFQEALAERKMAGWDFAHAFALHYWSDPSQHGGQIDEVQALKMVARDPGAIAGVYRIIEAGIVNAAVITVSTDVDKAKKNSKNPI